VCMLGYIVRDGKLHWIWHIAHEVFPLYSDVGFNTLEGVDIMLTMDDSVNEGRTFYYVQQFRLADGDNDCTLEVIVYDDTMKVKEVLVAETSLGVSFVPVVIFDVDPIDGVGEYFDDLKDTEILTTQLNKMMEDASDSLAFEM